ncbi:hypothetical protein [Labrys sp. ZIDIC5]|uniref:hypothetical protein n=1 Tax=Labrys sedimenti TaxID=3106036 RepID=UPI002ACA2AA2|nr:hypothetical protein [Labrys sp. ZIDIC5]MDZ5453250.1 hypothetical protein [Labrys sp. ZIDIC5]
MARYLVKAKAYVDGRIIEAGEEVELVGKVREEDEHLELVPDKANEREARKEAEDVDAALRAEAVKAKLVDDAGAAIDEATPIEVVSRRLAEYKQANAFR